MTQQPSFTKAVTWSYTLNWGDRIFSALFVLFLASLLGPRDFGVVSIAIIYVTFLQMFLDSGFNSAIIQRKNLSQEHLDSVFIVNLVLGVGLVIVGLLFSHAWAAINGTPEIAIISSVLSLSIFIQAMTQIHLAILTRQMNFRSLSIRTNLSTIASGIVGTVMAYAGFGVWSLVCQRISADLISLVLVWKMSSWRPSFKFSWQHVSELMGFSVGNFLAQLALFFDQQAGSIVLGVMFGPAAVGLYRAADRLMTTVAGMAVASIQHVSLPQFSRFQDRPQELRNSVRVCVQMSAWVSMPALAGLAVISGPLMNVIGPNWVPATDALKVLCIYGVALVQICFTVPLMQAHGKTRQVAILEWTRTLVGLILVAGAGLLVRNDSLKTQVMSIAAARLILIGGVVPIFLYLLVKLSTLSIRDFVVLISPSVFAAIGLIISIVLFRYVVPVASKPLIQLIEEIFIGGVTGLTILLSTDAQLRILIRKLLKAVAGDRRGDLNSAGE
jgi:PST family polysaccharide transporter